MSAADFRKLADLFPNETVTHSYVQDIELPAVNGKSPGTFALVTLEPTVREAIAESGATLIGYRQLRAAMRGR